MKRSGIQGSLKKLLPVAVPAAALPMFLSLGLASYVMEVKRQSPENSLKWQSDHYDISFFRTLKKINYFVTVSDGYVIHATLIENPSPSDRYVIISHGHTDTRFGSLKYAGIYLDLGFNCIIYDLRAHGENKKTFVTFGIREGRDIADIVKDTRNRFPNISVLGIHGESLGAASSVSSLAYSPEIDFAVSDCAFSDIENVLRLACKNRNFPDFFVDLADLGTKIRYHYSLKKMRPIDSLGNNKVPVLFIHGTDDDFITPDNSERMALASAENSELRFIKGAKHAGSVFADPASYKKYVADFLSKHNLLP